MLYPWQLLCKKLFYKCKTSVCSESFSLKYFYWALDILKSKSTHSPLSSSRRLPRGRYSATSDVKRAFSSHFIREQIKVLQLLLSWGEERNERSERLCLFFLQHTLQNKRADGRLIRKDVITPPIDGIVTKPENSRVMPGIKGRTEAAST